MLSLGAEIKVYLYTRACDMRRGFDVLAAQVTEHFGRSVAGGGGLFVFFSRGRDRVKILYWDGDGYALWYKRLEVGTFRITTENETEEISGVDLKLLLSGVDLQRIKFRNKKSCEGGTGSLAQGHTT